MKLSLLIASASAAASTRSCLGDCDNDHFRCTRDCDRDDVACRSKCNRELDACQARCNGGGVHVLMFEPSNAQKQVALSVWPDSVDGREETIDVQMQPNYQQRKYMCSFALKGKMYLVGGYDTLSPGAEYRQFVVNDDKTGVVQLDNLQFEMRNGACVTYSEDYALLCASYSDPVGCQSFDGEKYTRTGSTVKNHYTGGMAAFNGGAIIVAGYKDRTGSTEFFDPNEPIQTMWQEKMMTAEFEQFDGFAMVGFKDSVYMFGGQNLNRSDSNAVYRMHGAFVWDRQNYSMAAPRSMFRALANDDYIVLIGSIGNLPVEFWKWNGETFEVTRSRYTTDSWRSYPESFLVAEGDFNF